MVLLYFASVKAVKFTCQSVSRSFLNIRVQEGFPGFKFSYCTTNNNGKKDKQKGLQLPEEPQNCCMSGCANCVWVTYAEELAKLLNDGGETAKNKIMEHVKDPNLRAFLMLELHHLFKKNN